MRNRYIKRSSITSRIGRGLKNAFKRQFKKQYIPRKRSKRRYR